MESVKTNEQELTSTMGGLLSTSKEEKSDASDSTPTSSTDAFKTTSTLQLSVDDPISSTSSDAVDNKRMELQNPLRSIEATNQMTLTKDLCLNHTSSIVSEKDLLDMNITDTSTERITENVDDIVQDLENLLGEPTTTFDFTIKPRSNKENTMDVTQSRDISMELDDFSAEFQMLQEKPNTLKVEKINEVSICAENKTEEVIADQKIENYVTEASLNEESSKSEPLKETDTQNNDGNISNLKPTLNQDDNVTSKCITDNEQIKVTTELSNDEYSTNVNVGPTCFEKPIKETQISDEIIESNQVVGKYDETQEITEFSLNKEEAESIKTNSEDIIENVLLSEEKLQSNLDEKPCLSPHVEIPSSSNENREHQCLSEEICNDKSLDGQFSQVKECDKDYGDCSSNKVNDAEVNENENLLSSCDRPENETTFENKTSKNEETIETEQIKPDQETLEAFIEEPEQVESCKEKTIQEECAISNSDMNSTEVIAQNELVEDERLNNEDCGTTNMDTTGAIAEEFQDISDYDSVNFATTSNFQEDQNKQVRHSEGELLSDEMVENSITNKPTAVEIIEKNIEEAIMESPLEEVSTNETILDHDRKQDSLVENVNAKISVKSPVTTMVENNTIDITTHIEEENIVSSDISVKSPVTNIVESNSSENLTYTQEEEISIKMSVASPVTAVIETNIFEDLTNIPTECNKLNVEDISETPSSENNIESGVDRSEQDTDVTREYSVDNAVLLAESVAETYESEEKDDVELSDSHENIEEKVTPSPSLSDIKSLENAESMLPLVMEDVGDLDVLNTVATSDLPPEMTSNIDNDTLLATDALVNEEQRPADDISFGDCIDTALPTVEEIFAEQNDQPPVELPDDNLETLLAVASLQGVCESDTSYNMEPVEDMASFIPEKPVEDEKSTLQQGNETFLEVSHITLENEPTASIEPEDDPTKNVENIESHSHSEQTEDMIQHQGNKLKEPLVINVDDNDKEKVYSPKITIKPIKSPENEEITSESDEKEGNKGSLKMTITKQSDTMHSILKIYDPEDEVQQHQSTEDNQVEPTIPKLIIRPIVQPNDQPQSPKISTRSSKQVFSPSSSGSQRSASPRITIKPIVKPDNVMEPIGPMKITIKPVLKPEESHRQKHSPKLTIKPIVKPEEEGGSESKVHSPRVTIKPIVKPSDELEQAPSPRITIKPIVKPDTVSESIPNTPRVTIKPVVKPQEKEKVSDVCEQVGRSSPKITIKPIVKPQEPEIHLEDFEESIKERIVLKINKGTIPTSSKELRKRDLAQEEEKSEKTPKIKLKFSKEGGHPHIVQEAIPTKRSLEHTEHDKSKRQKIVTTETFLPCVTITPIGPSHSKLKEVLSSGKNISACERIVTLDDDDDDVTIVEDPLADKLSPIVISEESNQDSINVPMETQDPISEIPVFEITPGSVKTLNPQPCIPALEVPVVLPTPRKRGRPRKVPLQVREEFKDPKEEEPKPVVESTRPKRSCRGQSVRTTLGIKPRKPRGPGRGRGSKRGMGTRSTPTPPAITAKTAKEPKLSPAKLKPLKEDILLLSDKSEEKPIEIDDGFVKSTSQPILAPPQTDSSTTDRADIVMYEEETRMSAETNSRAQTPAKQVVSSIPSVDLVEESQSSVQSTATTESVKVRKGPRLEVHQEPEGAVISADQLAEYYWSGGGPYMLQEQVAQFLGIKSFKRKYPNISRRVVDMQERDFIRESGLAGEAMCDLGLTAVNSTDILDIMYSDFQDKYEEYCKHQRDRQAKDLTNKQKALSLAASQEKTKLDITQQAVQSAATWNANFNKTRRDQRKACMDLQTLTVHYPKGKMKQINKPKIGYYPVALVPGQFTDYYKEFTPTEINNLPLNTLCYDPVVKGTVQEMECESQTDGSGSESDTSTSDSDSSYSGSSDGEDCTLCHKTPLRKVTAAQ